MEWGFVELAHEGKKEVVMVKNKSVLFPEWQQLAVSHEEQQVPGRATGWVRDLGGAARPTRSCSHYG